MMAMMVTTPYLLAYFFLICSLLLSLIHSPFCCIIGDGGNVSSTWRWGSWFRGMRETRREAVTYDLDGVEEEGL